MSENMVECVLFDRPSYYSLYWSLCEESVMVFTFPIQESHFKVEVSTFTVQKYQGTCECLFAAHRRFLIYTTSWHLVTFFKRET